MADDEDFSDNEKWEAYRQSAAFRRASFHPPDEIWTIFSEAEDCCDIIDYMKALVKALNIDPNLHGIQFYEVLKSKLTSWKCQSLWDLLNARLKNKEYKNGTAAKDVKCLIIGAGPIGLRTAIELLLLGCKVSIVEKRTEFTRNNVLHLWPFLLTDFRSLGAKKFYGKFGAGCIDHINIRTLQCILLKVVLILGGEVHTGVSFKHMVEPKNEESGWTAAFEPENLILSKSAFDVVIGADGKKNVLPGFPQIELRGALAIGITCNFVNNNTIEEARVPEISGVSYQFNPNFFKDMDAKYGVKLENIVYYKNETHYFVMTALKSSLLQLGVLKKDSSDPKDLLSKSNIDKTKLVDFTLSAVNFATDHQLPPLEFKKLSNGDSDIALFDFTSIKKAANASRIIERKKHKLAMALVGDSLIEPFWPTGSGCGRGVLSALDVAWMVRQFALKHPPLSVLRERENIFKLLGSSSNDSLQKNYAAYTIDPRTRYSGFDTKRVSNMTSLKGLYDTDDLESADMTLTSPSSSPLTTSAKKVASRKRSTSGGARKVSTHLHPGSAAKHKRKSDRGTVVKEQPDMVNTKQFWEEHNKKNFAAKATEYVPKTKVSHTSLGEPDLSIEELSELEDDVIESEPTAKKGFNTSQKIAIKRQASRDEHKSTSARSHSTSDEASGTTKRKYQAKGGGLKTKRTESSSKGKSPEKTEENKSSRRRFSTRKRQSSHKKATPEKEKKEIKEEYVSTKEPPRYVSFDDSMPQSDTEIRKKYRSVSALERKLNKRKNRVSRKSSLRSSSPSLKIQSTSRIARRRSGVKYSSTVKRRHSNRKAVVPVADRVTNFNSKEILQNKEIEKKAIASKERPNLSNESNTSVVRKRPSSDSTCDVLPKLRPKRSLSANDASNSFPQVLGKRTLRRSFGRSSLGEVPEVIEKLSDTNIKSSNYFPSKIPCSRTSKTIKYCKRKLVAQNLEKDDVFNNSTISNLRASRMQRFSPLCVRNKSAIARTAVPLMLNRDRPSKRTEPQERLGYSSINKRENQIPREEKSSLFHDTIHETTIEQETKHSSLIAHDGPRKMRLNSNFRTVRLNSVKNKRRSMVRMNTLPKNK